MRSIGTNKNKKIIISIGIVAVVVIGYLVLNLYALNNLQFSEFQLGGIDLANTSADIKIKATNPTVFPASFERMNLTVNYQSTKFGAITVHGATISPYSEKDLDGTLKINAQALAGLILASLFGGGSGFDINQLRIVAQVDAPIFGMIPYSISKEYSAEEFANLLSDLAKRGEQESSELINPFK